FGGKVSILSGEENLVQIDNFGINYSTSTKDVKNNGYQLMSFGGRLILYPGTETGIISAKKAMIAVDKHWGFAGFGKKRAFEERHLLITIKAIPMSFEDMIEMVRNDDPSMSAIAFSQEEFTKLPESADTREAYNNME